MTTDERLEKAYRMASLILSNIQLANPSMRIEESLEELVELLGKRDEEPPKVIEAQSVEI